MQKKNSKKIREKQELVETDSTRFKILFTLIRNDNPMTLTEIAKETKLDKELVFHHLPKLKKDNLLLELNDKTYIAQPLFYEDDVMEDLNSLMKILIKIMLRELKEDMKGFPPEEIEKAVKNNLELFIQTFSIEIMES